MLVMKKALCPLHLYFTWYPSFFVGFPQTSSPGRYLKSNAWKKIHSAYAFNPAVVGIEFFTKLDQTTSFNQTDISDKDIEFGNNILPEKKIKYEKNDYKKKAI